MQYGTELILDMGGCDVRRFNRKDIRAYCRELCELIDMKPEALHFWDDFRIPEERRQTNQKTKGTTAIQFILTSNITIHTLDMLGSVFVNIFSCKDFDAKQAEGFTVRFFGAQSHKARVIQRGL